MIWNFSTMKQWPFEFFWKFARSRLLLLRFCQMKEILKPQILLILLKYIFVGYSNANESFADRLFSNYGPLNILFHFFRYLIYSVFHKTFVKKFIKKLSFFSLNFKKSISRCSMLQKIRMFNFVILKWRQFEYKVKSWKTCPFLRLFF